MGTLGVDPAKFPCKGNMAPNNLGAHKIASSRILLGSLPTTSWTFLLPKKYTTDNIKHRYFVTSSIKTIHFPVHQLTQVTH